MDGVGVRDFRQAFLSSDRYFNMPAVSIHKYKGFILKCLTHFSLATPKKGNW